MTDIKSKYCAIRNEMLNRIGLFEQDMRDAIATGECAIEDGDLEEERYLNVLKEMEQRAPHREQEASGRHDNRPPAAAQNHPLPDITPATADFRYKEPLLPRLRNL